MYTLKAMARIPSFIDNEHTKIAMFGEISNRSRTYSIDQETYRSSTNASTQLVVFSTKTDVEDYVAVPSGMAEQIISIQQWIYDKAINATLSTDRITVASEIGAEFNFVSDVEVGEIASDGLRNMPSYFSFQFTNYTDENYIKVWFSDEAFRSQYDDSTLRVISPVTDFNLFHTLTATELRAVLEQQTKASLISDLNGITEDTPATLLRAETFTWIDPLDGTQVPTVWGVAIYGEAGNNIDTIRRTLIDYVLSNSTQTREEWVEILPDLFRSNEFIFSPRWEILAIETESQIAGVYSPFMRLNDIQTKFLPFYPDYPAEHVAENSYVLGTPFNNVPSFVVGGPENKNEEYDILEKFPEYIPASPSEASFMRMDTATQLFASKLLMLLTVAETATSFSQLPNNGVSSINRIVRNGRVYVSTSHDGVEYMVITKRSYLEVLAELAAVSAP